MRKHYEWVVCACCFLFLFVNVGFPSTAFGVYVPYIVDIPGMSHSSASLVVSLRSLVTLLATFFVAHYFRRLDCRAGVALGVLLTAVGFAIYAFASSLPLFLAGSVFAGLGYGLGGAVGSTLLIGRWFKDDVGKAAGFAAIGSGAAGAVIPLIVARIVAVSSLRAAFLFQVALALVICLLVSLLLRNRPHELGLEPHQRAGANSSAAANDGVGEGIELSRGMHAALVAAMACVGAGCIGGVAYIGILMTSNGISELMAATMISVVGVGLCIGKFAVGAVMDAIGSKRGSLLFFILFAGGLLVCCLAPLRQEALCLAAAALFGLGASLGSTGLSVWSIQFSNASTRAKVARDFQSSYAAGGLAFNLLPGILMDLTGTYVVTFALLAALVLAAAIIVLAVYRHIACA